ncbi:MAG: hypothetical protein RLZZ247_292, partial [Cyanobacteriota bacterium]
MGESGSEKRRITLELSGDLLRWIDGLKSQMGFRNRGLIVEQLLRELVPDLGDDADGSLDSLDRPIADASGAGASGTDLTEPTHQADAASAPRSPSAAPAYEPAEAGDPTTDAAPGELDDNTAIVLIGSGSLSTRDQKRVSPGTSGIGLASASGGLGVGIQLPGFVRRQARAVKRSLAEQAAP